MELPNKSARGGNGLWRSEVAEFARRLEELSGRPLDAAALGEGIRKVNAKRAALARLYQLRQADPAPISGKDALLISQIAFYDDVGRFTQSVNALCDELEQRRDAGLGVLHGGRRIVIAGSPMAIPNWKLHHIVETSGGVVVCEESCTGTRYFEGQVADSAATLDGQLDALAERYGDIPCACFSPNEQRLDNVVRYAREWRAEGVIDYTLPFCHCYNIEHELLRQRLRREGIPLLHIESDYSLGDFGQLATRVKAFIETLG